MTYFGWPDVEADAEKVMLEWRAIATLRGDHPIGQDVFFPHDVSVLALELGP